jgi:hypothetical protein
VPNELEALLPPDLDCTPGAVAAAMQFLADDFMADVATDYGTAQTWSNILSQ